VARPTYGVIQRIVLSLSGSSLHARDTSLTCPSLTFACVVLSEQCTDLARDPPFFVADFTTHTTRADDFLIFVMLLIEEGVLQPGV
jgi:hypothetical protein